MSKPLREKTKKSGFSNGVRQIKGVKDFAMQADLKIGDILKTDQVLELGDVVKVQGISKGRGFAGVVKRYGFAGGKRTHGQSDRQRAPGSIGAGTDPGRVWKGKRMPGHYGVDTKTVTGLVVVHLDPKTSEVWLSGPVPGFNSSIVRISKTGDKKSIELDFDASGIEKVEEPKQEAAPVQEEAAEPVKKEEINKEEVKQKETK